MIKNNSPIKHVIFIVIDSLRAKSLGCYGSSKDVSPNINHLASDGVLFEQAFSCAISTDPSLTTIFSGCYPLSHGIIHHGTYITKKELKSVKYAILLPEVLKTQDFKTYAIDWLGRWHRRGYDVYYTPRSREIIDKLISNLNCAMDKIVKTTSTSPPKMLNKVVNAVHLISKLFLRPVRRGFGGQVTSASEITNIAMKIIKENYDKKMFLMLHYWDVHKPYYAPICDNFMTTLACIKSAIRFFSTKREFYKTRRTLNLMKDLLFKYHATSIKELIDRYSAAINYVDQEIGKLLHFLDNLGTIDSSVIVLTGDHGESFVEHGIFVDHHGLYDVTTHVPLILKAPNIPKGKRIKALVQHVDIMPTILNILGVRTNINMQGKSLIPLIWGETEKVRSYAFAEEANYEHKRSIRSEKYKFIKAITPKDAYCKKCECIHGGIEELYDLEKDPEEKRNLADLNLDIKEKLNQELQRWVENCLRHRLRLKCHFIARKAKLRLPST